jgi:PAS domain S-box-containing protein
MEQQIKESEEKFRALFENTNDPILINDHGGKFIEVNKTACEFLGYSKEELMNLNLKDIAPPQFVELLPEFIKKLYEKGYNTFESEFLTKDGRIIPVELNSRIFDYKEKQAIITVTRDITDRKQSELKLKESMQKFRNIAEQSLMGIGVVQDGIIKYSNETLAKICGYSTKEMMNWSENEFKKIIHLEAVEFVMEQAKKKQLGEEDIVRNYQFRIITKSGDVRWVDNYSQSTFYEGRFADLVSWTDITERRKSEEKLLESEAKYREAFDRTTFYKDLLTHDMNNILQVIQLTLEISSLDENISKELKESLDSIKNQVFRGSKLISNVHKLSQLEESQKSLKNIDINNVLKASLNFLKNSFKMKKIDVKVETPRKNYLVKANSIIREIFENILINAVKYNENSTVELLIRFSEEQKEEINYIKVEFMDNGRGIPDSIKKIIFHKGFLEEKQSKGMGIGLTLVKKAIETYSGQIWVEDRIIGDYTEGSNFIIMIPEAL